MDRTNMINIGPNPMQSFSNIQPNTSYMDASQMQTGG